MKRSRRWKRCVRTKRRKSCRSERDASRDNKLKKKGASSKHRGCALFTWGRAREISRLLPYVDFHGATGGRGDRINVAPPDRDRPRGGDIAHIDEAAGGRQPSINAD